MLIEDMQLRSYGAFDPRLQELLGQALASDPAAAGFEVHYQPIVRVHDGEIAAVEALARWRHPVLGEVPPAAFFAAAERVGLAGVVDDFSLACACADANVLADACGRDVAVHVNVSPKRLGRLDLDAAVAWALRKHSLRPGQLVLEVADTTGWADTSAAAASMRRLKERGVRVAIDDFGTGFDTLALLQVLSVDIIKLDARYISPDPEQWRSQERCRSVLEACERSSVTVVAEGVETISQSLLLQDLGCQLAQGYLYGRPLPLAQLAAHSRRLRATAKTERAVHP